MNSGLNKLISFQSQSTSNQVGFTFPYFFSAISKKTGMICGGPKSLCQLYDVYKKNFFILSVTIGNNVYSRWTY